MAGARIVPCPSTSTVAEAGRPKIWSTFIPHFSDTPSNRMASGTSSVLLESVWVKDVMASFRRVLYFYFYFSRSSEPYLAGKLKISRISRARDRSKGGATKRAVGIVEWRSVADVEDFRTEFQIEPLRQTKRLANHQVGILKPGPPHGIPRAVANAELAGSAKGRLVEPLGSTSS